MNVCHIHKPGEPPQELSPETDPGGRKGSGRRWRAGRDLLDSGQRSHSSDQTNMEEKERQEHRETFRTNVLGGVDPDSSGFKQENIRAMVRHGGGRGMVWEENVHGSRTLAQKHLGSAEGWWRCCSAAAFPSPPPLPAVLTNGCLRGGGVGLEEPVQQFPEPFSHRTSGEIQEILLPLWMRI